MSGLPPPPLAPPLFSVDVSGVLGADFAPMANDFMRMLCIQLAIQILVASNDRGIFTSEFFILMLYIALGVLLYWAVIRRVVAFS